MFVMIIIMVGTLGSIRLPEDIGRESRGPEDMVEVIAWDLMGTLKI